MNMRRFIAFLLLTVYLFAVGGPSYASLSCKCVAMKSYTVHACCHYCDHADAAGAAMDAPCCGNHHSTEINLYTGSSSDESRSMKCAVIALPPSLISDGSAQHDPLVACEKVRERPVPFLRETCLLCIGFRAPPVLA